MSIDFEIENLPDSADEFTRSAFAEFNETILRELIRFTFSQMKVSDQTELSIALVGEQRMEELHLEWMNLPGSTDVMSFPMDELEPGTDEDPAYGVLGDILLCPPVAAQQAQVAGHSTVDELCLLTVHGILHCLGYDHESKEEEAEMFGIQRSILEEFLGRPAPAETRY